MQTYKETILRYRIVRHEELPEAHKAEYRLMGINPDDNWSLIWSFSTEESALKCLEECREDAASFQTYKMIDAGAPEIVERQIW
jgi:hypothetical protein